MLSTIIGLILTFAIMLWSIMSSNPKNIKLFIDFPSMLIVLGCSMAALVTNFTFPELWQGLRSIRYAFKNDPPNPQETIDLMVNLAVKARRQGLFSLKDETSKGKFPMYDLGVSLLADGADPENTAQILDTYSSTLALQEAKGERIWRDLSVYAPMFGMLGTLIGLVMMLKGLSDPSTIGPAMAIALVTTFYGVVVAGMLCLPLAGKIHNYNAKEALLRELIIEGILSVQAGNNSQIISEKLNAHLKRPS